MLSDKALAIPGIEMFIYGSFQVSGGQIQARKSDSRKWLIWTNANSFGMRFRNSPVFNSSWTREGHFGGTVCSKETKNRFALPEFCRRRTRQIQVPTLFTAIDDEQIQLRKREAAVRCEVVLAQRSQQAR